MNLFRNLLFWLVLALVGALVAQLLVQDPGYLLLRYRGMDYSTTLAAALLIVLATLVAAWVLWRVLTAPFAVLRRRRERAGRARLIDGLNALHQGEWSRAEKTLLAAAEHDDVVVPARLAASRAAAARGDTDAAARHLDALGAGHPAARAVALAELALAQGRPADALGLLDAAPAQPLPPRGLALRAQALTALGRAGEAYGLLGALRQQQALPADHLDRLEAQWAEASLDQAADANLLADRWEALPKPLKIEPVTVAAYATRAAALRWDEAATRSLEHALDARWDESLAVLYGRLAIGRLEHRQANAERWLQAHPASPGVLLTLARLARAQGHWSQAEGYLHRAIAQGAGSEGWEELGAGYAQAGDETLARLGYANALLAARGEPVVDLPGRDLRQRISDEAAIEERDDHGVPRLRG